MTAVAPSPAPDFLRPLSERRFNIYALSLPNGPNFHPWHFHSGWTTERSECIGAVLCRTPQGPFATLVLRRRVDHRFWQAHRREALLSFETALSDLTQNMEPRSAAPLPPGEKRRPSLFDTGKRTPGDYFKVMTQTITHYPALMTIGEIYLSMPRPDDNFVPDMQTNNFNSRLWELYLLAAFREQDVTVTQPHPSPDYYLERSGAACWVEAVTANAEEAYPQGFTAPAQAPSDRADRLVGATTERFAKTIRSKLQREYERASHVQGCAFAIAIADFHAPGSMVWSRESLPSYLYGVHAQVVEGPAGPKALGQVVSHLRGPQSLPAGLFRDPAMAHLSAVIFSNAATFSKFNRMGLLAGWRPRGLTMIRQGLIFDRTPGALEPKTFALDVLSDEYAELWPGGEAWCHELEVFHNPLAAHPIDFDLLPGATHWFEDAEGELTCEAYWECSVLSSITHLRLAGSSTSTADKDVDDGTT